MGTNLTFVVVYHACKFMTWLYCPNKSTVQNGSVDLFKDFLRGKSERTGHATSFRIVFFFVPLIRNIFRSENCPEVMEIASRFICMTK